MSKHTPGPWRIVWGDVGDDEFLRAAREIVAPDGFSPVSIEGGLFPYEPSRGFDSAEIEANARLIAAAPEMLEALEAILKFIKDNPSSGFRLRPMSEQLTELIEDHGRMLCTVGYASAVATSAIKKARGEE